MSNIHFNAKNYTDIQGLTALKGQMKNNSTQVAKEVAQQFEALMVQMMMKSMRAASQAFSDKESHGDAFELYQELFDKQLSMTPSGLGIAKQIEAYLKRISPSASSDETTVKPEQAVSQKKPESDNSLLFASPVDFVKGLWSFAKSAASELGLHPGVLLAQAALETNWGKQIISQAEKGSSYNLFNIKADPSWKKERAITNALEDKGGVFKMEKSAFRKYQSFAESFHDYVDFIKTNPRYEQARANAHDPRQYLQALQQANYATDQRYSDKILDILYSKHFNELIHTAKIENQQ